MSLDRIAASGKQRGSTLVGFIVGLVLGLLIAVGVALFITKAPIPFINKVARTPDAVVNDSGKLPDPNKSLYSRDQPAPVLTAPPAGGPTTPVAGMPQTNPQLANVVPRPPTISVAPAPDGKAPVVDKSRPDIPDGKPSFLQAGAFKSSDDADNMKAKLALLGFEARVAQADKDGTPVYRVRLGPYAKIDDMNRARQRLAENGVDVSLVAPTK